MLIYFGGSDNTSYKVYAYKYDILNDNYTRLSDIPFEFHRGSAVAVEDNVYLIGSAENDLTKTIYKYDTKTDTYTQLSDLPYEFYSGSAICDGSNIYVLGGNTNSTTVQILSLISKEYTNKSVIIAQNKLIHKTNIANYGIQNAKFYYDEVYYQDENGELLTTIPTYNGNGTEWVKISGGEG